MPTGLKNSPTATDIPTMQNPSLPQQAINITLPVLLVTTGLPQACAGMRVPHGASVNIRGSNGQAAGNSGPVFAGQSREDLANGGGRQITPDTEIFFPVDNTANIWIRGTAGDGVQVILTANPIG